MRHEGTMWLIAPTLGLGTKSSKTKYLRLACLIGLPTRMETDI